MKKSEGGGSSSKKSLSKRSRSSSTMGIYGKTKVSVFELGNALNSSKTFFGQSKLFFFFEAAGMLMMLLFGLRSFFIWDIDFSRNGWINFAFALADPMIVNYGLFTYIVIFASASVVVFLGMFLIFFVFYTKTSNETILMLINIFTRSTRTIFLYPVMSILLSPLRCYFLDGSFDVLYYDDYKFFEFPFLLFTLVGAALGICLFCVGICDSLFLLSKYKGIKSWIASPDGRVQFLIYILQCFGILFGIITIPQELDYLGIIGSVVSLAGSLIVIIGIIRFIPWFHYQYVFFVATVTTIYSSLCLISVLNFSTRSYYPSFALVLNVITLPILWIVLCIRYILLIVFFRKKIRSNFFLCYYSVDIAIGIFVSQHFKKFFNIKRRFQKRRVTPETNVREGAMVTASSIEMINLIQTLMDDEDFEKTKALCAHLVTLVIDRNPLLAKAILNHTHTIMKNSFFDVELALDFYRLKITNIQETGHGSSHSRKNQAKMLNELNRARKREETLSKLILMLLQELSSEDRKVNFSNFPQIISSIQNEMEFCEKIYSRCVKIYPSPLTYRRFANYLLKYTGDCSARVYLKEAKQLEFTRNDGPSSGSANTEGKEIKRREVLERDFLAINNGETNKVCENENENEEEDNCGSSTFGSDDGLTEEISEDFESSEYGEKKINKNHDDDRLEEIMEIKKPKEGINSLERTKSLDGFSDEGSVNTFKNSVASYSSGDFGEDRSHVHKKVVASRYIAATFVQCYCCSLLIYIFCAIIAIFALSFVLSSNFSDSAELIEVGSMTSKCVSEIFHFLRKLQVSYYDEYQTPLPFERDPEVFRNLLENHCGKVLDRVRWLYSAMSDSERAPFQEVRLDLYTELVKSHPTSPSLNEYSKSVHSLIDSIQIYGDMCYKILEYPSYRWGGNKTAEEIYGRIQDEKPFFFIRKNEPMIVQGMETLSHVLIDTEASTGDIYMIIYILFPSVLCLFIILNCLACAYFSCQQRKTFKGFFLIPTEEIHRLMEKYGNDGNEQGGKAAINSTEEEVTTTTGQNSNDFIRVDTSKFSLIQEFCLYSCGTILIAIVVFTVFAILGSLTCNMFTVRNEEFDYVLQMQGENLRVHLWTTEILYRNDSLFETSKVIENARRETLSLTQSYEFIRFGYEEHGLPGNDKEETAYNIYYNDVCDYKEEGLSRYEFLRCHSMNAKVDYMRTSAQYIIRKSQELNSNLTIQELRSSQQYQDIIMIENYSNGSIYDAGGIQENFNDLREYTKHKVDDYLSYLNNFSLLLMILYFPLFSLAYILLFRSFSSRLNRNLTMPRRLMLLMDKDILLSKNVYEYLTGKSSNRGFNNLFRREKTNRLEVMFDIVEMANYGFICFDSNFNIVHYNTTANELFQIMSSNSKNLKTVFNEESMKKIRSWISRGLNTSFNGELVVIYQDQEYPVLADISRSKKQKKLYIGIFENLENTKKKDLLKESERRTQQIEILMRNILPKEIADSSKLEDFELGLCKVYQHKKATAYFMDICNFTGMSQQTNPETIINVLHKIYCNIDVICEHHGLEKIKTIGDCYFAVSGIPTYKPLHAVTAMEFAIDVLKMMVLFNDGEDAIKDFPLQVRTGLSSGKLVAGIIGKTKRCYDIWGPMINEAARMESNGIPGKIQISRSTYESIFDKFKFIDREIHLQGIGANVLAYLHTPNLEDKSKVIEILSKSEKSDELKKKKTSGDDDDDQGSQEINIKNNMDDNSIESFQKKSLKEEEEGYIRSELEEEDNDTSEQKNEEQRVEACAVEETSVDLKNKKIEESEEGFGDSKEKVEIESTLTSTSTWNSNFGSPATLNGNFEATITSFETNHTSELLTAKNENQEQEAVPSNLLKNLEKNDKDDFSKKIDCCKKKEKPKKREENVENEKKKHDVVGHEKIEETESSDHEIDGEIINSEIAELFD